MDAVVFIWEEDGFPDEPISGNTDDTDDYGYLDHIYTNNMPETRKILGEFYEIIKSYTDHERISMLEVYLSPEDILPYYDVGDFPFNFELLFYEKDPTADDVLNRITSTLDNLPEGKHANWVVSIFENIPVFIFSQKNSLIFITKRISNTFNSSIYKRSKTVHHSNLIPSLKVRFILQSGLYYK